MLNAVIDTGCSCLQSTLHSLSFVSGCTCSGTCNSGRCEPQPNPHTTTTLPTPPVQAATAEVPEQLQLVFQHLEHQQQIRGILRRCGPHAPAGLVGRTWVKSEKPGRDAHDSSGGITQHNAWSRQHPAPCPVLQGRCRSPCSCGSSGTIVEATSHLASLIASHTASRTRRATSWLLVMLLLL